VGNRDTAYPSASLEAGPALDLPAIRRVLERALARVCPPWLAAEREDLAQAAIVRILEVRARRGADAVKASSYVWRTAYSVVVDEIRRRKQARTVSIDPDDLPPLVEESGPEADLFSADAAQALRGCLAALAEPRRLAVVLHLQGHRLGEGARLLGFGAKRYENLAYRGLADLRRCLEQKGVVR
jgi:RNA polymerase sigma-70 factor (ECF subfamily)